MSLAAHADALDVPLRYVFLAAFVACIGPLLVLWAAHGDLLGSWAHYAGQTR